VTDLVTLAEVRATGLTDAMADDDAVEAAIALASEYVERVCGVPFSPQTITTSAPLLFDGTGHDTLWLDIPILTISEVGEQDAEGNQTAYTASTYAVYNRRPPVGNDRRNPKIVRRYTYFPEGRQNIYVAGTFGWCDPAPDPNDEDVPPAQIERAPALVRRAVILLVVNDYAWTLTDAYRQGERLRRWIKMEVTEGHSYTLSDLALSSGPSGIREVDQILRAHARPLAVRA